MTERLSRKILSKAEWLSLVRDGLHGGSDSFGRQVQKLASRLQAADPDMATALQGELGRSRVLRSQEPMPIDGDSRQDLLQKTYPVVLPRDPVWDTGVDQALARVVAEWRSAGKLREAGLSPVRSVLLSGPPGVGKTLAAHWLAMQLDVPLLTLDLATVMNNFLGKTGQNLRLALNHALATRSVLLLDEFDAIAKRRDDDSDVGELKRLVNVLLQAIDNWSGESLLVAATNHPDLLDPAVWRRFDVSLTIGLPEAAMVKAYLERQGLAPAQALEVARLVRGVSFADIERWLRAARKDALLNDRPLMPGLRSIIASERSEQAAGKTGRDGQIWSLHQEGKSAREIGRLLGVTHPTVRTAITRMLENTNG